MPDSGPAAVNFDLWRGSNIPPVILELDNEDGTLFDVTGSEFVLTIKWAGGSLRRTTAAPNGFILDPTTSELTWTPTLTESRLIPLDRTVSFEIERRIGGNQEPLIAGFIKSSGGNNDD